MQPDPVVLYFCARTAEIANHANRVPFALHYRFRMLKFIALLALVALAVARPVPTLMDEFYATRTTKVPFVAPTSSTFIYSDPMGATRTQSENFSVTVTDIMLRDEGLDYMSTVSKNSSQCERSLLNMFDDFAIPVYSQFEGMLVQNGENCEVWNDGLHRWYVATDDRLAAGVYKIVRFEAVVGGFYMDFDVDFDTKVTADMFDPRTIGCTI